MPVYLIPPSISSASGEVYLHFTNKRGYVLFKVTEGGSHLGFCPGL